jgi:hypothetical protein
VLVKETDGARNEEKEPDAMYSWRLNGTLETEALPGPVPDVIALRPFVPAKDFEKSLSFFADLGFRAHRLGDQLASMHIGPFAFLLQGRPNDDERFAANFMMHMLVEDIDAWWSRIATLDLAKRCGVKAPCSPKLQPWGLAAAYVWDPSGVLNGLVRTADAACWHIAKFCCTAKIGRNRGTAEMVGHIAGSTRSSMTLTGPSTWFKRTRTCPGLHLAKSDFGLLPMVRSPTKFARAC